jgi:hypothetical protein
LHRRQKQSEAATTEFLLILESGAGGYAAEASRACKLATEMIIELALIAKVGTPDENALAGALRAAGKRHGVLYQLVS